MNDFVESIGNESEAFAATIRRLAGRTQVEGDRAVLDAFLTPIQ